MLTEEKILINKIKDFRKLRLDEASDGSLRDAIQKHKIISIYYNGDDTMQKGHRTIRPFVIGTHKDSGNKVLRAWQDAGSSASYRNIPTSSRWGHRYARGHEFFDNPKQSGNQPGWRLFRVDKITAVLPSGKEFDPQEYFNVDGVAYNPNDDEINVEVAIQKDSGGDTEISGTDSVTEPDVTANKISSKSFDKQTPTYQQFFNAAKKARQATENEIKELRNYVKRHLKKSPKNYWVIQDENDDMVLKTSKAIDRGEVPQEAIVGNLSDLHKKFVASKERQYPSDFSDEIEPNILKQMRKK